MKKRRNRTIVTIGVTGGIGSGKSEVCRMFEAENVPVFYADDVAKTLMQTDRGIQRSVRRLFGSGILDDHGGLDRKLLAKAVFSDRHKRERLNSIVHPSVFNAFDSFVRSASSDGAPFVVVEAALIFESGMDRMLDYVVAVDAPLELRLKRLRNRDAAGPEQVRQRIDSQMPVAEKLAKADFIVRNDGSLDDLKVAVGFLMNLFRTLGPSS